jgi:hypothetical protein
VLSLSPKQTYFWSSNIQTYKTNHLISSVTTTVRMEHLNKWNIWILKKNSPISKSQLTTKNLMCDTTNVNSLKILWTAYLIPQNEDLVIMGTSLCCLVLRTTYKNYEIHQHSCNWSSYAIKIRLKSKHINGFYSFDSAAGSQKQPEAQWKQAENSFTLRQPMMFYECSETECLLYCSTTITIHQIKLNS